VLVADIRDAIHDVLFQPKVRSLAALAVHRFLSIARQLRVQPRDILDIQRQFSRRIQAAVEVVVLSLVTCVAL
jgi:hypothetical protein